MTWYKEFSEMHNNTIRKGQKPRSHIVKVVYFGLIMMVLGFIIMMAKSIKTQPSYRRDPKYKKVIKEGVLFDTIEYHEK